ncbi:hypothetical protein AB0F30_33270 [Streptomyces sp. NPDC029006]|uniref:hypothetical protein n=1 Tax=Streptomyces sp. NPDC029006 TaxID=3155467 RepID=UPI0033F4D779
MTWAPDSPRAAQLADSLDAWVRARLACLDTATPQTSGAGNVWDRIRNSTNGSLGLV